jgi:alcohol dehydrogenase class IV
MINSFVFEFKPKIIFGPGKVKSDLAGVVKSYGKDVVVGIVTDKGVIGAGLLDAVTDALEAVNIQYVIFADVEPNPTNTTTQKGAEVFGGAGVNVLLAVGGGSAMDVAKTISIITTNGGKAGDYLTGDERAIKKDPAPLISIPTTAGTGSEVTFMAIITFHEGDKSSKKPVASQRLRSKVVILDPTFLLTVPYSVAAYCGLDVISHAIEALFNTRESPIADVYAYESLKLVNAHLRPYVGNRGIIEDASGMLLASTLAGAAFDITFTNLNHSMSHAMSAYHGVPHGIANAILMPHTMRYYMITDKGKFKKVAECLGEDVNGLSDREAAPLAIKAIEKLMADLEVPTKMSHFGITEEHIPTLVKETMADPIRNFVPRTPPTAKDVEKMFREAL